jgi:hypothetical protein
MFNFRMYGFFQNNFLFNFYISMSKSTNQFNTFFLNKTHLKVDTITFSNCKCIIPRDLKLAPHC